MKFFEKRHLPDSANNDEEARKVRKTEINDFIGYVREIWSKDKDQTRSIATDDPVFWESFGFVAIVTLDVWELLSGNLFVPDGGCLYYLLWDLMCLKIYCKERTMCSLVGGIDKYNNQTMGLGFHCCDSKP